MYPDPLITDISCGVYFHFKSGLKIMDRKKDILVMISQKYPFGFGEIYLERELRYLSQRFDEVHLYPLNRVNNKRAVPENVFVNEMFCNRSGRVNKWYALKKYFDCKKGCITERVR